MRQTLLNAYENCHHLHIKILSTERRLRRNGFPGLRQSLLTCIRQQAYFGVANYYTGFVDETRAEMMKLMSCEDDSREEIDDDSTMSNEE